MGAAADGCDPEWRTRGRVLHLPCGKDRPERGSGKQESRKPEHCRWSVPWCEIGRTDSRCTNDIRGFPLSRRERVRVRGKAAREPGCQGFARPFLPLPGPLPPGEGGSKARTRASEARPMRACRIRCQVKALRRPGRSVPTSSLFCPPLRIAPIGVSVPIFLFSRFISSTEQTPSLAKRSGLSSRRVPFGDTAEHNLAKTDRHFRSPRVRVSGGRILALPPRRSGWRSERRFLSGRWRARLRPAGWKPALRGQCPDAPVSGSIRSNCSSVRPPCRTFGPGGASCAAQLCASSAEKRPVGSSMCPKGWASVPCPTR